MVQQVQKLQGAWFYHNTIHNGPENIKIAESMILSQYASQWSWKYKNGSARDSSMILFTVVQRVQKFQGE